jgi:hypothetical protein
MTVRTRILTHVSSSLVRVHSRASRATGPNALLASYATSTDATRVAERRRAFTAPSVLGSSRSTVLGPTQHVSTAVLAGKYKSCIFYHKVQLTNTSTSHDPVGTTVRLILMRG